MTPDIIPNANKLTPDYCPTFARAGTYINDEHRGVIDTVSSVHGQLRDEDAWKLYEMAYYADGPVLEIGCLHGKSTTILALGIRAAANAVPLISVDVNEEHCAIAQSNVRRMVPEITPQFRTGYSNTIVAALATKIHFAFVDGNHTYGQVKEDLPAVDMHLRPGGFMLLHDYFDSRNHQPPENPRYGVVKATEEFLTKHEYQGRGRFGCCALYQKQIPRRNIWTSSLRALTGLVKTTAYSQTKRSDRSQ